jgi:clathrin heavy chain
MARKSLREPKIDTELAYAYAKTDRLHDMEDFLAMTNVADILEVGEKCFEDELYQAAIHEYFQLGTPCDDSYLPG